MRKLHIVTVGLALFATFAFFVLPAVGDSDKAEIAKANAQISKIIGQCKSQLQQATSASVMNAIASNCDAQIHAVLSDLESKLGHPVTYTVSQVCVTNKKVNYTVCFDPIHIGGSGE